MSIRNLLVASGLALATLAHCAPARAYETEDWTTHRNASFTMTGDVTVAAKRMKLGIVALGSVAGDGGVYVDTAQDIGEEALKKYAAEALIANLGWVTQVPVIGSQIASAAAAEVNPYLLAAAVVVMIYNEVVTANNTMERSYMVYAPTAARYRFNVHFKGHWLTKPANTITVIRSDGSAALYDTRVLSSDGDYDYYVDLPEGTTVFKVGLGSGSVNFHTAGQPNFVWLDDSVERTFTTRGVQLVHDRVSIASFAPAVGGDYTYTTAWSPNASSLIDGRVVSVDNVQAQGATLAPLTYAIAAGHITCGEVAPPPVLTTQLDAVAVGSPQLSGNSATWTLHRNADRSVLVRFSVIRDRC